MGFSLYVFTALCIYQGSKAHHHGEEDDRQSSLNYPTSIHYVGGDNNQLTSAQDIDQLLGSLKQINNEASQLDAVDNYSPSPIKNQIPPRISSTPPTTDNEAKLVMLGPEQAQMLKQIMPELNIKSSDQPVIVNPEQLAKIQNILQKTNFKLPPGFPPEFVESIKAAAKAKPKIVHRATVVRTKNKEDKDPEEFVRNLPSYKKTHGIEMVDNSGLTPAEDL